MTVIAWDGKTLAADKRMTGGGGIARTVAKIVRGPDGCLLAITGGIDVAIEMREWYVAGAEPKDFPAKARDDTATLIVITATRKIFTYNSCPYPVQMEAEKAAFGSGRDYAEAAMHFGKSAIDGVEVACHFQTDCGNGIDTLELL